MTAAPVGDDLAVEDVSLPEPSPDVVVASLVLSLELADLERVARLRVVLRLTLPVPVMPADGGTVPIGPVVVVTVTFEDALGEPEAETVAD